MNEAKPPKPDLSLHTLIHFLDRFVYRNVKTTMAPRGAAVMQPLLGEKVPGMVLMNKGSSKAKAPLNAASFVSRKPEEVSVDEVFFHKYFSQVGHRRQFSERKAARKTREAQDDDEGRDEDGNDEEIWKAIVGSRPEMGEADGGDDDDMDLDESNFSEDGDDDVEFGDDASQLGSDMDVSLAGDVPDDGPLDVESGEEEPSFFPDEDVLDDGPAQADLGSVNPKETRRAKRRKLKDLPTFASAEDYAAMLGGDDEE